MMVVCFFRYERERPRLEMEFRTQTSVVGSSRLSLASQERKSKKPSKRVTVPVEGSSVSVPAMSMVVMPPFVVHLKPEGDLRA